MRVALLMLVAVSGFASTWHASSYNILVNPDRFDKAWWFRDNTTVATGQTDPDGGTAASKFTASNAACSMREYYPIPASGTYTLEVTAKISSGQWVALNLSDFVANAFGSSFDLTNGVTGAQTHAGTATLSSRSITSLGSGWYKLIVTGVTGTSGLFYWQFNTMASDNSNTCTVNHAVFAYHAALYRGSSATGFTVKAVPQKLIYWGFVGDDGHQPTNTNTFMSMQTPDGGATQNAFGLGYTYWSAGAAGQVNAPRYLRYKNADYFHVAKASDGDITEKVWYVGLANTANGIVSTTATIDWTSSISGVTICFSGRYWVDSDGTVRVMVPCGVDVSHLKMYISAATATDLTTWSTPTAVTGTLPASVYDPQVVLVGSTYYLWYHDYSTGYICLATSSAWGGDYTPIKTGNWAGWGTTALEGLDVFHNDSATSWRAIFEDYTPSVHQMYYSDCDTLDFTTCTWTSKTAWTEAPLRFRNGDVIRLPGPEAGAALAMQ